MLDGRRVLITGGSSGIGRALTRSFVEEGARVWTVGRRVEALAETIAGLEPSAEAIVGDLSTDAGRRRVATAIDHSGGTLDVVIHNAGALGPPGVPLAEYPEDAWDRLLDVNLTAVQRLHTLTFPQLERGRHPAVIAVSSSVGRTGRAGWGMYAISKAALENWAEVLADEWDGGRVYSVNPGGTATPMRAQAMPGEDPATIPTPDDIMPVFLWLAHESCDVPTGSKLNARDHIGLDPWDQIWD